MGGGREGKAAIGVGGEGGGGGGFKYSYLHNASNR